MNHYEDLKAILKELFQLDQSDLDFWIYRILNAKREEVENFLDNRLLKEVWEILASSSWDSSKIQKQLDEMKESLQTAWVSPEDSPKYMEIKKQLEWWTSTKELEQEVFSHLTNFFSRYYKDWDFISLRRYKADTYAIPYEWEEVKLYRANHDQYYIKSSENLKNYAFKVWEQKVVFRLVEATTEQNNNKALNNMVRLFELAKEDSVEVVDWVLIINFTYELHPKATKQKKLNEKVLKSLSTEIPSEFHTTVFDLAPTEKNKKRTIFEKHLNDFTAKHTFDYFIHKDLDWFLSRELDFYIKNEVLHLDDIDETDESKVLAQIWKIKAIKKVAKNLISFLWQLEDFQKKLWEKKKFVTNTQYCITIDLIPQKFYWEILLNSKQIEERKDYFNVDIEHEDEFKENPYLVLDTRYFDNKFKDELISIISENSSIEENLTGLMINSENRQAINLITSRYKSWITYIYIDPPYNAKSSEILYKNTFKHSSRLSLMENRISIWKQLLSNDWVFTVAIDENEEEKLSLLLSDLFSFYKKTSVSVIHNPWWIQWSNFSYTNEFAIFLYPDDWWVYIWNLKREKADIVPLRDWGWDESKRETAQNCFYPIYVKDWSIVSIWDVCDDEFHPESANVIQDDWTVAIYPVDPDWVERKRRHANWTINWILEELRCDDIKWVLNIRREKSSYRFKTVWDDKRYNSNTYGSKYLGNILWNKAFSFPKSIHTVYDSVFAITQNNKDALILDYFAGSWTTWHAVMKLNRKDGWRRKFIEIEMWEYFYSATLPRTKKVAFTDNRNKWIPQDSEWSSQFIKYHELESYEDTLNNLQLSKSDNQQLLLSSNDKLKDEYMMKYMLDIESKESLLSVKDFIDPFNYTLSITKNNETKKQTIDLVETFNYLIWLKVDRIYRKDEMKLVEWYTLDEKKVLIVWRNQEKTSNEVLNAFFKSRYIDPKDEEFDIIYVNGDTLLENLRDEEHHWKVKMIEETFLDNMFEWNTFSS